MAAIGIVVTVSPVQGVVITCVVIFAVIVMAAGIIVADFKSEREAKARIEEATQRHDTQVGLHRVGIDATLQTAGETQRQLDALVPFFDEPVEALAHEMNGFLWERRAMEPPIQSTSYPSGVTRINPNPPGKAEHDLITCRKFFEMFDTRLREYVDELARRGFADRDLDRWSRNYLSSPQVLDGIVGKLGELSRRYKLSRLR